MGEKVIYTLTRSDVIVENNRIVDIETSCIVCKSLESAWSGMTEQLEDIKESEAILYGDDIETETDFGKNWASVTYNNEKNTHGYSFRIEGTAIKGKEINSDDIWEVYDTEL